MDSNNSRDLNSWERELIIIENEEDNKILCIHCKRTKSNKLSCLGMCVADSEY